MNLPYRRTLLGIYAAVWLALAIAPSYRADWLLENVLVVIALPLVLHVHRRLSDPVVTALFVFFLLHALGAHYTYAEVPYDRWAQALTGHAVSDLLGLQRNHYDRLVHFAYGLLVTPAFVQWMDARLVMPGAWRSWLPFCFMASHAAVYEVIEWGAAEMFGGDLGQAYLGTQGDVWDAQKDSGLALLGAALCVLWLRRHCLVGTG